MQAVFEKLFTHLYMAMTGAQYIHYAFGLLDRTNSFCPLQAVLDNEQIGKIKHCLREPRVASDDLADALQMVKKVMAPNHQLFTRHTRKARHRGEISSPYHFEAKQMEDQVIEKALNFMTQLESEPAPHLEQHQVEAIFEEIPGLLPNLKKFAGVNQ